MGFPNAKELWRTWEKTIGNCTTSVTYHPWNKRTQNVELRTCVLLALERAPACVRECVCIFLGAFRRFGVFGGGKVLGDGDEEEEELEDGVGVGVGRSAHTAQGGRSACQVQVHAGTRQDPTHSQPR